MWKEFFSSIGINGVKVDTVLKQKTATPGKTVDGVIHVKGGQAAEPLEKIQLLLYMQYEEVKKDSDFSWHEKQIEEITIHLNRDIEAGEKIELPFSITLPASGPKTDEQHKWFVRTTVFVDQAVDPEDEDELIVL